MGKFVAAFDVVALIAILAGVKMGILDILERQFIFFPTSPIERTPSDLGLFFEDVYFETGDGLTLNGWFVPAPASETASDMGNASVTILWMHGNGGNISHRVDDLALFHHLLGVNVFLFDYRGYGNSQGKPSAKGVYLDSRAALAYLATRSDVHPEQVVFFGRSLGAAVAVELALHRQPPGMILHSPFTSIAEMGRSLHPHSPLPLLAGNRFDSLSRIGRYHGPLLVVHGEQDEIVPLAQGRALFMAANSPKSFHLIRGASHNDNLGDAGTEMWAGLRDFLLTLR